MKSQPFFKNVVVITGASSGIGLHLALQLAEQGARLVLAARNIVKLNEVAELCRKRRGQALVIPTDVSEQPQCQNLIESTIREYGGIDTLINNAGISMHSHFEELQDVSLIEKIMQVNFFGSVYCTYFALPYLKQSNGRLVGISSYGGKFPSPTACGYGASKHAMNGFFDSLRVELENSEVSVTMVYFSWFTTGISSRALGADGKPLGDILNHEIDAIPVEKCTRLIIQAAAKRKREYIPLHGKIGQWIQLLSPKTIEQVSLETLG